MLVIDVEPIRERFSTVAPFLDERGRRLVAAAEAFAAGYGGITAVATATGMAPSTIGRGLRELAQDEPSERVRRPGAGRKPTIVKDPTLVPYLEALVEHRHQAGVLPGPGTARINRAGIVNLAPRGMLVVSVARRLRSEGPLLANCAAPLQQSGTSRRHPGSVKLTMPVRLLRNPAGRKRDIANTSAMNGRPVPRPCEPAATVRPAATFADGKIPAA